jgi:hypothetical protein
MSADSLDKPWVDPIWGVRIYLANGDVIQRESTRHFTDRAGTLVLRSCNDFNGELCESFAAGTWLRCHNVDRGDEK